VTVVGIEDAPYDCSPRENGLLLAAAAELAAKRRQSCKPPQPEIERTCP
jgi:hypothetical protein